MIIKRKLFSSEIIIKRPVIKLRDEYKTGKKAEEKIEDYYEPEESSYDEEGDTLRDYLEELENN